MGSAALGAAVFGLVYWDLDCGGPMARVGSRAKRDFWFPQLDADKGYTDWEPRLVDYLYLGFTNATAFSPTVSTPVES